MLIAKVQNNQVVDVADSKELFPNTSFPSSGPSAEFLTENGCMHISIWKQYDNTTKKLVSVNPYIEDNQVFTVAVEPLTEEEIAARDESAKQKNKKQAENLLAESDWADNPSVVDTSKALHLVNAAEWDAYRDALRMIAVVPTVEVEWPVKPEEIWSV